MARRQGRLDGMAVVTMQDIAERAGVTRATVSLALRNHSRISRATCQKIQRLAQEMGYRPNPMITSLMAGIRARRQATEAALAVAYLQFFPRSMVARLPSARRYRNGAAARAAELGFRLEEFWLGDSGLTVHRLNEILYHRNIGGVLIPALPRPRSLPELPWNELSAAAIGYTLLEPKLHRAINHQMHAIRLVVRELVARGYRRLGLALSLGEDQRVEGNWRAGFYLYQESLSLAERIPVFLCPDWDLAARRPYCRWAADHRPEVVIALRHPEPIEWLAEAGFEVPGDIGFATLGYSPEWGEIAGIDQNDETVGRVAMELVAEQLHHNQRGVPSDPKVVLVEGKWVEGKTVRPGLRSAERD